LHTTEGIVLK